MGDQFECGRCGKKFGSQDTLERHLQVEHEEVSRGRENGSGLELSVPDPRVHFNLSLLIGFILGIVVASAGFSGYVYWDSMDHRTPVEVTVVSCDNCSYERFRTATDRMFNAHYREVDYRSEKGRKLIEKYSINYVPAFIFDKNLKKTENFRRVKNTLVEFDDAFVIPDKGVRVAQRLSTGKALDQ